MLSPGTPSSVAHAISQHLGDPVAMAKAVVEDVMAYKYAAGGATWGPAAAFDVLDLARPKWNAVETTVKTFNDAVGGATKSEAAAIREDARAIDGMVRFPEATPDMPWHADRPAIALYDTIACDGRRSEALRSGASQAAEAIKTTLLAHGESGDFSPFAGANYANAAGPTVHFPVSPRQIDPWAPRLSERDNTFYKHVDGDTIARIIA